MHIKSHRISRYVYGVVALAVVVPSLVLALTETALAVNQVTSRSIQLSSSTPSATSVNYLVTFTPVTTESSGEVIVDFCSNSPIAGDSCTAVAGTGVPDVTSVTGTGASAVGSSNKHTVKVTGLTITAATPLSITLGGIINPSATGTFYARIFTYATGGAASYVPANGSVPTEGSYVDYGGIALSTANAVSITAKVQETLTFCVSKAAPGNGCTSTSAPNLTLGHGSPATLDSTAVDTDTAYTQVSSNATTGVVVNLKVTSSTACAGLSKDSGVTCGIPAIGSFAAMSAGTADFGLNVADGTGGTGSVSHNANYGTTSGSYAMRAQTLNTYGDAIESSSGPTANVNSLLTYAATASATTAAGIYTTTESLIATGTY